MQDQQRAREQWRAYATGWHVTPVWRLGDVAGLPLGGVQGPRPAIWRFLRAACEQMI